MMFDCKSLSISFPFTKQEGVNDGIFIMQSPSENSYPDQRFIWMYIIGNCFHESTSFRIV